MEAQENECQISQNYSINTHEIFRILPVLYYDMKNYCNLIGLEQWYFRLI